MIADSFPDDLCWARPQATEGLSGRFENLQRRGPRELTYARLPRDRR